MEDVGSSQKREARSSGAGPEKGSADVREYGGITQDALVDDNAIGREAPTSLAGYGGCGGDLPSPKEQSKVNRRYERAGTVDLPSYVEEVDGVKEKEGSGGSNGFVRNDDVKNLEATEKDLHPSVMSDHRSGDQLLKEEKIVSADETERKPLKTKLKEMLPGHHDHKHADNGQESGLAEMPYDKTEENHGVLSKLKHKIVETHEKNLDEPDPEVWG